MRSTFIIATCALAVLAAPVPEAEPIFKSGGTGCAKRVGGLCIATGKREASPIGRGSHPRDVESDDETTLDLRRAIRNQGRSDIEDDIKAAFETRSPAPEPIGRGSHPRDIEDDDEVALEERAIRNQGRSDVSNSYTKRDVEQKREPLFRASGRRDIEEEDDIEARAIRNQGRSDVSNGYTKRDVEQKREPLFRANGRRDIEEEDDIEARAIRNQGRSPALSRPKGSRAIRNQGRSPALSRPKGSRAIRNQGKRSVREKTVTGGDIEARTVRASNKRYDGDVEARAIRNEGRNAEAEPQPFSRNHDSYRRSAEANPEPSVRGKESKRTPEAEPGTVRGSN